MRKTANAFIGDILWTSPVRRIGDTQWRAMVYLLPERYGKGLTRFGYQFRKPSHFGSPLGAWQDARDHRAFATHKPNNGLPMQLGELLSEHKAEVDAHLGYGPDKPGRQLSFNLAA